MQPSPTKDAFNVKTMKFPGLPAEEAAFLLRPVAIYGEIGSTPATLPDFLVNHVGAAVETSSLRGKLTTYLNTLGVDANTVGGALTEGVSKTANDTLAKYFVIHDTSSPTIPANSNFPNMDSANWSGNDLTDDQAHGLAHIYTNRLGKSVTAHKYDVARTGTKFELKKYNGDVGPKVVGLFLGIPGFPWDFSNAFSAGVCEEPSLYEASEAIGGRSGSAPCPHPHPVSFKVPPNQVSMGFEGNRMPADQDRNPTEIPEEPSFCTTS
jgi:hypothetical protein